MSELVDLPVRELILRLAPLATEREMESHDDDEPAPRLRNLS